MSSKPGKECSPGRSCHTANGQQWLLGAVWEPSHQRHQGKRTPLHTLVAQSCEASRYQELRSQAFTVKDMAKCWTWQVMTMVALGSLPQVTNSFIILSDELTLPWEQPASPSLVSECEKKLQFSNTNQCLPDRLCGRECDGAKSLLVFELLISTKGSKDALCQSDPGKEEGLPGLSFCKRLKTPDDCFPTRRTL